MPGSRKTLGENVVVEEPTWLRWIASCPQALPPLLMSLAAIPGAFIRETDGHLDWWWLALTGLMIITGGTLTAMRMGREEKVQKKMDEETRRRLMEEGETYEFYLEQIGVAIYLLVNGLMATTPSSLKVQMEIVRKSILGLIRSYLGPETVGVRANLFIVDRVDPPRLVAWGWGHEGGSGTPSRRVFEPGDKTFDLALRKYERYEPDTAHLPMAERSHRGYGSFATYPVSSNDKLFGIVTIDAPRANDIQPLDVVLLGYYAGMLAITFSVVKDTPAIDRRLGCMMWGTGRDAEEGNGNA
ncbi:GAF domain-containing protein [Corynebacterium lowii]|uniref:GAF domain-containing protein n=1 Tax=Corynebacterium lowii TaxID=1544413 RepID=A0A0Q0YHX2_9CORY|nr:GAF domain-containing protein [Corynebacterium lowii]KQB86233.1 hypothetical protein Clow_01588 [Corynebacterium lowii]MDP9852707.1 hypothetical protein [Corynebacterium lowii]